MLEGGDEGSRHLILITLACIGKVYDWNTWISTYMIIYIYIYCGEESAEVNPWLGKYPVMEILL